MQYGAIPGVSDRISRLVFGSLVFLAPEPSPAAALLERFLAAGGTAIDTAHSYGKGAVEGALGAWLAATGRRAELQIITKGAHPEYDIPRRVTPADITHDLTESLERLGVATVDLYLLHRDDPAVPVGPLIDCLNEHQAAGRIRAFGASNWTIPRLEEADAYAAAHGLRSFIASSPNLALAVPSEPMWPDCLSIAGDPAALDWYRRRGMPILAWSSQASGFFSGRFTPAAPDDPNMVRVYYRPDNWERLARGREVAERHGCTPTQVALAWVLHQPLPVFALIGPRTTDELDDCLGALEVALTPDEVAWLNLET